MATNEAVAALMGLPVIAKWEAITETDNGLSGLILCLAATSEMIGKREYTMCAVPANKQRK